LPFREKVKKERALEKRSEDVDQPENVRGLP
jgi:hypothetical protein